MAADSHFPCALTEAGLGLSLTDIAGTLNCPSPAGEAPHRIVSPAWHCLSCQTWWVCDDHRAAAALSYGIKCLENDLLWSSLPHNRQASPSAFCAPRDGGLRWVNPNPEPCCAKKPSTYISFFFSSPQNLLIEEKFPKCFTTWRGSSSLCNTNHPSAWSGFLEGCLFTLTSFSSFPISCLAPSLGKVSAGKGETDPSLRAVLGREHTGTCSSHFGTIPGTEPHILSGMIPTVSHLCRLGVLPSRNGINPPSRLLQSSWQWRNQRRNALNQTWIWTFKSPSHWT